MINRRVEAIAKPKVAIPFSPASMFRLYAGVEVPDPITFTIGSQWLNRPNLYPRQATLLKIIFLRKDLFTWYDEQVIQEWQEMWKDTNGNAGVVPGLMDRIDWLIEHEYRWFKDVMFVMGRRAGKGHVAALAIAYVLWNYLSFGDPQAHYGIDRDKKIQLLVFAGKRDQAKSTVYGDVSNVITGSECFLPFISRSPIEKLTVFAPYDFVKVKKLSDSGVNTEKDPATFEIMPKEAKPMAGRGGAVMCAVFDEEAHMVATGASRSAAEIWDATKPSTDQFGKDAFIVEPSSPWEMMGQFWDNWQRAIALDENGFPSDPDFFGIQLASWDIYKDFEISHEIPLFPEGYLGDLGEYVGEELPTLPVIRNAIQAYDEAMEREEAANPETFAVERRAQWATSLTAYLNKDKVEEIFKPWSDRLPPNGPPEITASEQGVLSLTYHAHGDPSKVNDKFGLAVAHTELDEEGKKHVVFDLLHHFDPADFEDHTIDYEYVEEYIWTNIIKKFMPEEMTFDQFNSINTIQKLNRKIRIARLPKRVTVREQTSTRPYDWKVKENAKAAINLGRVHAPYHERAELELKFLQLVNGRVDHPSAGPVQSKDIADAMTEVIHRLIGKDMEEFISGISSLQPAGTTMQKPNINGVGQTFGPGDGQVFNALSNFGRRSGGAPPGVNQRWRQGGMRQPPR